VPTSYIQIIRKGAHLNFAMGASLHRYATGWSTFSWKCTNWKNRFRWLRWWIWQSTWQSKD